MNQLQIQLYPRRDGKIGYQLVHLPTRKIKARSRSYSRIRAYRDVLAVRLRACAR